MGYFAPYAVLAAVYYTLFFLIYKRAFSALSDMVENCMGLRDTLDVRRREADDYRKKELCAKVGRLGVMAAVSIAASALFMLLAPWFALAWAVRLVITVVAVVYAYNVKADIYEEAEKIL